MSFAVAVFAPHNDGAYGAVVTGPEFVSSTGFVDLYEMDGEIRGFAGELEAMGWLRDQFKSNDVDATFTTTAVAGGFELRSELDA